MRRTIVIVVCLALVVAHGAAVSIVLDRRDLEEAIAIGQSRIDTIRQRFHAGYRIVVSTAPLDYIEVVTPWLTQRCGSIPLCFSCRYWSARSSSEPIVKAT